MVSDSLQPHRLQHARPPCPSPTPRVYSNSCPLSQWRHPNNSSSVIPFSSCLQSFPASGSFSSHQVAKVLEFQLQHQSFRWIFRTDFLQDGLVGSPCSPRDSQESSPKTQFKSINSLVLSFLYTLLYFILSYTLLNNKLKLIKETFFYERDCKVGVEGSESTVTLRSAKVSRVRQSNRES